MIRNQYKANRFAEHLRAKNDTSLSISEAETASDSGYRETESQPILEDESSANKLFKMHSSLRTSELLLVVERETVL